LDNINLIIIWRKLLTNFLFMSYTIPRLAHFYRIFIYSCKILPPFVWYFWLANIYFYWNECNGTNTFLYKICDHHKCTSPSYWLYIAFIKCYNYKKKYLLDIIN